MELFFIILVLILLIIISLILSIFFVLPFLTGAPYEGTKKKTLEKMIEFTNPKKGDKIAELGSGDGRIVIALAKKCPEAKVYGFEINPFLVWISKRKIKKQGLKNAKIYWKNFWNINLGEYNKIVLFQFKTIMHKLSKKFSKELKSGTKIISHFWKIPEWKLKRKFKKVYYYEKSSKTSSSI